jgi:hypothetical protein
VYQRRNSFYIVIILLGLLLGLTACSPPAKQPEGQAPSQVPPNANPSPTSAAPTRAVSPTPVPPTPVPPTPEPIPFDTICSNVGRTASIEGILQLPNEIACTSGGSPNWCTVHLVDVDRQGYMVIGLNMQADDYDPRNNYMADLPISYEIPDFRVRTQDGKLVGEGDLVKVTGQVTSPLLGSASGEEINCSLEAVNKIEQVDRLTIQGPEKLTPTNLVDAILNGWVIASISGDGLSQIDISLKPQVDFGLELEIEPGTIFEAQSGGVQNMVLRRGTVVVLKPEVEISLELEVSCANMELKEPSQQDSFLVNRGTSEDLARLLKFPEFRFESIRIQQFAIWTITDNPSRTEYTGITDQSGTGSGPTDEEFLRIRDLLVSAGVDPTQYQAYQP